MPCHPTGIFRIKGASVSLVQLLTFGRNYVLYPLLVARTSQPPPQTTLVCPFVDYSTLAQVPLVMTQAASIKSREPAITDCTLIGIL
jgi:hypothetical protein